MNICDGLQMLVMDESQTSNLLNLVVLGNMFYVLKMSILQTSNHVVEIVHLLQQLSDTIQLAPSGVSEIYKLHMFFCFHSIQQSLFYN